MVQSAASEIPLRRKNDVSIPERRAVQLQCNEGDLRDALENSGVGVDWLPEKTLW